MSLVASPDLESPDSEDQGLTGLEIVLPKTCGKFDTVQGNFEFYKVALLHQLGYQTFHTLRYLKKIERTLSGYHDHLRARTLFNVLEGARIDWQWPQRLGGDRGATEAFEAACLRDARSFRIHRANTERFSVGVVAESRWCGA